MEWVASKIVLIANIVLEAQGVLRGASNTSEHKPVTKYPGIISEAGFKLVCLNARSSVNKNNELNITVEDIDPHIIGITESWANRQGRC